MPVPEAFVGVQFNLSANVTELRVRKDSGGKSRRLTGPVVTFEVDDAVNVAQLLRARTIAPRGGVRAQKAIEKAVAEATVAEQESREREGG